MRESGGRLLPSEVKASARPRVLSPPTPTGAAAFTPPVGQRPAALSSCDRMRASLGGPAMRSVQVTVGSVVKRRRWSRGRGVA